MPYRHAARIVEYTAQDLAWFRKPLLALLLGLILAGCAGLVHVPPEPRDPMVRAAAAVKVFSTCSDGVIEWREPRWGSGVVISERHVLTAAHVVECPTIPIVYVLTSDGYRHRMVVTREDGSADIAKLEKFHGGLFGLGIPPPSLQISWDPPRLVYDYLCAEVPGESATCGKRLDYDLFEAKMEHGDSGAGVYDRGYLVGLVIRDVVLPAATRITIVDASWLAGT